MSNIIKNVILVLSALCGFMIIAVTSGITFFDCFKYLSYSFFYVLFPGWVVYLVLIKDRGTALRQFCLGWALGYVLEGWVYLFRPLLGQGITFYGTMLIGFCLFPFVIPKLKDVRERERIMNSEMLAYIIISIGVILVIKFCNISGVYLPSETQGVTYYQDLVWHLSLAGEVKWHNFPFQNPSVSGEPMRYYFLPYIHIATASSITGIDLSRVVLRLFPFELYFLWAMVLCWAGRELIGKFTGVATASLVLLIGSLSGLFVLNSARKMGSAALYADDLFFNYIFWSAFQSPGFLMGIVFFVALIVLIAEATRGSADFGMAKISLIILLIAASAFTKSVLMPILIMGIAGILAWQIFIRHNVDKVIAILFLLMCVTYVITKSYTQSIYVNYVKFTPFKLLFDIDINSVAMYYAHKYFPGLLWLVKVGLPGFVIFGYAPLSIFGFMLFIIYRKLNLNTEEVWLMSLYLGSFFIAMLFSLNGGEWGFLGYGSVPLAIMSTKGLTALFKIGSKSHKNLAAKFIVLILLISGLTTTVVKCAFPTVSRYYYVKRYGEKPLLSAGLFKGLRWLRENTPRDAVIAVNFTQDLWKEKKTWYYTEFSEREKYFYYSAFSERRFFLEGTFPTPQFHRWANVYKQDPAYVPFADRRILLSSFFDKKDRGALIEMRDKFNVSYVLVDKRRELNVWLMSFDEELMYKVYSNSDVDIYQILKSSQAHENSPN